MTTILINHTPDPVNGVLESPTEAALATALATGKES
jgi:hypothetical protein